MCSGVCFSALAISSFLGGKWFSDNDQFGTRIVCRGWQLMSLYVWEGGHYSNRYLGRLLLSG